MKKMLCLIMIFILSFVLFASANAESLTKMEQDVFDSIVCMFEESFFTKHDIKYDKITIDHVYIINDMAIDYGFPADGQPSEFDVHELLCFKVEDGADYAYIRFSRNGVPMDDYFGMYIETFGTEEQIQFNKLSIAFTIADEGTFDYSHYKQASQGMFSFVYLTDKGIEGRLLCCQSVGNDLL